MDDARPILRIPRIPGPGPGPRAVPSLSGPGPRASTPPAPPLARTLTRRLAPFLALALVLTPAACATGGVGEEPGDPAIEAPAGVDDRLPTVRREDVLRPGVTDPSVQTVRSPHGAIAAASVWAAEEGARVLAEGGNAADAAVAAAWVLAVTEPSMSGIGGRASIVIRTEGGEVNGIDGLNQVPRSYREGVAPPGYDRVAIPGVPAALYRLHAEHGSLPMSRLLTPAIRLAEEGFALPAPEAQRIAGAADDLLAFSPESARGSYLQPDGTPWPAGAHFRLPDLARTLRILRDEGVESFYRGEIARTIDADMRTRRGFITTDELAAYEALPARLVRGMYRGHALVSNFRPASGHAVIQALQTLEAATPEGLPALSHEGVGNAEAHARWAALVGQAMEQAIGERNRVVEESESASAALLTSSAHARERAREIVQPWRGGTPDADDAGALAAALAAAPARTAPAGSPLAATPAAAFAAAALPTLVLHDDRAAAITRVLPHRDPRDLAPPATFALRHDLARLHVPGTLVTDPADRESTTHLTVVDARGMIVSLTQSLGPSMGARVVAPGLGFVYATRLGVVPGSRPSSTIAPTLVLRPDGSLLAGLGGAGDARILSAVIQTVSRLVDHGLPLDQAVAAPRVHPDGERNFRFETGATPAPLRWTEAEAEHLTRWGFTLESTPPGYFGRVHAVGWTPGIPARATANLPDPPPTGEALGVAEPRWDGGASSPREPPRGSP